MQMEMLQDVFLGLDRPAATAVYCCPCFLLARFLTFMPEEQAIGIAKQPFLNSKAAIRLTLCGKYSWRTVVEPDIADLSR